MYSNKNLFKKRKNTRKKLCIIKCLELRKLFVIMRKYLRTMQYIGFTELSNKFSLLLLLRFLYSTASKIPKNSNNLVYSITILNLEDELFADCITYICYINYKVYLLGCFWLLTVHFIHYFIIFCIEWKLISKDSQLLSDLH